MAEYTDKTNNHIPCLLLPMAQHPLLLPTVCVAEMLPLEAINIDTTQNKQTPQWFLGYANWRGCKVPVCSFELLNGHDNTDSTSNTQLAILNTTGISEHLPFFALPTQGIPRLSRVCADEMEETTDKLAHYEQARIKINNALAILPNLDALQETLLSDVMPENTEPSQ